MVSSYGSFGAERSVRNMSSMETSHTSKDDVRLVADKIISMSVSDRQDLFSLLSDSICMRCQADGTCFCDPSYDE